MRNVHLLSKYCFFSFSFKVVRKSHKLKKSSWNLTTVKLKIINTTRKLTKDIEISSTISQDKLPDYIRIDNDVCFQKSFFFVRNKPFYCSVFLNVFLKIIKTLLTDIIIYKIFNYIKKYYKKIKDNFVFYFFIRYI